MKRNEYISWLEYLEAGIYSEHSSFLKFAILWLSFASYLNQTYYETNSERDKLNKYIQESGSFYKNILTNFKFRNLLESFTKTSTENRLFVENLQKRTEDGRREFKPEDITNIEKYINVIYQIRCNFFHGGKIPTSTDDEKLVKWDYESFLIFWKSYLNTL